MNIILTDHDKKVIIDILKDVYPDDLVLYTTATGLVFTSKDMQEEIEKDTEIGKSYSIDVLRICRDFLMRKVQREAK